MSVPPDPRPVRPVEPHPSECCGGGCVRCVFDTYELALEKYEREFDAWRSRQHAEKPREEP